MMIRVSLIWMLLAGFAFGEGNVTLSSDRGLLRDGTPYFIKGAGGRDHFDELAKRGGNSVRTWGDSEIAGALEQASKLGLTVSAGIWLEPECSWFSYHKKEDCARQIERVRNVVREHRRHPALLLWGLGNEAEGDGRNDDYWRQINQLARMVHEEDPAHPTFTAVAGLSADKSDGLNKFAPDLDLVGINTYGALFGLREHLSKVGWKRPWVVTEFGPQGFWESPRTAWNVPVEPTSTQKAAMIRRGYLRTIAPAGACLGSYLFLWGQKQEATSTWFGVFTTHGEITGSADVMQELWMGKEPSNHAPILKGMRTDSKHPICKAGEVFHVSVEATDPDGDEMKSRWEVADDATRRDAKGHELAPVILEGLVTPNGLDAEVRAPTKPGTYRVFVFVTDEHGHAATANIPFQVVP